MSRSGLGFSSLHSFFSSSSSHLLLFAAPCPHERTILSFTPAPTTAEKIKSYDQDQDDSGLECDNQRERERKGTDGRLWESFWPEDEHSPDDLLSRPSPLRNKFKQAGTMTARTHTHAGNEPWWPCSGPEKAARVTKHTAPTPLPSTLSSTSSTDHISWNESETSLWRLDLIGHTHMRVMWSRADCDCFRTFRVPHHHWHSRR